MNSPLNNAKVGASTLAACGYAPVQWKIALSPPTFPTAAVCTHPARRRIVLVSM